MLDLTSEILEWTTCFHTTNRHRLPYNLQFLTSPSTTLMTLYFSEALALGLECPIIEI